jgi:hypothetical protein
MTQEDQEHQELQRLFDATAETAPGPTLTKLAARAADIPERARKSRFLPSWAWGPACAGMAMALGALLALRATHHIGPQRADGAALGTTTPAVSVAASASASSSPDVSSDPEATSSDAPDPAPRTAANDEAGDSLELLGDADDGAHFDVAGPQSDRDLDAWLAATKELSGGT